MAGNFEAKPVTPARHTRRVIIGLLLLVLAGGVWFWRSQGDTPKTKGKKPVVEQVISGVVMQADVPVKYTTKGTVSALQTVEVRPQISATVKAVHLKEGQFVRKGELLFTLDTRTEAANLSKAEAQLAKDRADLRNAERNFERQRELFRQKFISQAALDAAQNQLDGVRGQLAVNQAATESSRVARSFGELRAPIAGRTGAIASFPGSLVQPNGAALVSITQINPIHVSFTLPENALAALQQALAKGAVPVNARLDTADQEPPRGRVVFVDNAVDTASGTIRLKAEFPNTDSRLWPGMFVSVTLAPQMLTNALIVPVQAVQTGPEMKFLYVIGQDRKVASVPIKVRLIQDGNAIIEGVAPGTRVVLEGAQNLRPGSVVSEADGAEPGKKSKKKTPNPNARATPPGS